MSVDGPHERGKAGRMRAVSFLPQTVPAGRPFFLGGRRRGQNSGLRRRLVAAFTSEAVSRPHRVGLVPPPAALPVLLDFHRSPQTLGLARIPASRFARPDRASTVSSCCRRQQHASRARCHAPGHMLPRHGTRLPCCLLRTRQIYSEPVLARVSYTRIDKHVLLRCVPVPSYSSLVLFLKPIVK